MEDFNVDSGEWFPNQRINGAPDECVAITVTDILGDKLNINLDPDFTYAMTLRLEGSVPTTAGSDPWSGMLSAVGYGVLPMSDADFTALANGELYVSNWQNYSVQDKQTALVYAQNGGKNVSLDFNSVLTAAKANFGVSLPMLWYSSFMAPNEDGTLPYASGPTSNHNVRVCGQITIGGVVYMILKPWLGKEYGKEGYCFMSQNQFIICAKAAYVFDSTANRFFSLLGIAITKYPFLSDFIPQLIKSQSVTPTIVAGFPPADIYDTAVKYLGQHITLDPSVPEDLGCAEAVSFILKQAGVTGVPQRGFAGTDDLCEWLKVNKNFKQTSAPQWNGIIVSPTQGANVGHCGAILKQGIASNDSSTGKFNENYSYANWVHSFQTIKGLQVLYFTPVSN